MTPEGPDRALLRLAYEAALSKRYEACRKMLGDLLATRNKSAIPAATRPRTVEAIITKISAANDPIQKAWLLVEFAWLRTRNPNNAGELMISSSLRSAVEHLDGTFVPQDMNELVRKMKERLRRDLDGRE